MSSLTIKDINQIEIIKKKIKLFEEKKINLLNLINDLTGILNILESISLIWKNDFQNNINTLEMVYDSIEDGSISRWQGDYKKDIQQSISALKIMITATLENYLKTSDSNILESAIETNSEWLICSKCYNSWESNSIHPMVICPKCQSPLHNPRASITSK